MNRIIRTFLKMLALIYFAWILLYLFMITPIPRGTSLSSHNTYYKNIWGVYHTSTNKILDLIFSGSYEYLKDVDIETFKPINYNWAKDANNVWCASGIVNVADVATFRVEGGLPRDKYNVYIRTNKKWESFSPPESNIDPETAEYFIRKRNGQDHIWIRDKDFVYLEGEKIDVDRNTFSNLGMTKWFIDKNYIYGKSWSSSEEKIIFEKIDSLQNPIDSINSWFDYIRNGKNIIYHNKVVVRGVEINRFEMASFSYCIVNDMLLENGVQVLKDSLNVNEAKFYLSGRLISDKQNVFYKHKLLSDIDASSFMQIDENIFEDNKFSYNLKKDYIKAEYPFIIKRK